MLLVLPLRSSKTLVLLIFLSSSLWGEDYPTLAWLQNNHITVRSLTTPLKSPHYTQESTVPLGSLWKLFVYVYLDDTHAHESPYRCSGAPDLQKEEQYCCTTGESIGRDSALSRSCSLYFQPQRLMIDPFVWKNYWETHAPASPWVHTLSNLQPDTRISIRDLLLALDAIPPHKRLHAKTAMLETAISGYGRESLPYLGSGIRYKTYSWHEKTGKALGGAAGWLSDGTPFWFGAKGSSFRVLKRWGERLSKNLPPLDITHLPPDGTCVNVHFFGEYPLQKVSQRGKNSTTGELKGNYQLQFFNGNGLTIHTNGGLYLQNNNTNGILLSGKLGLNEYIARVIDREANTTYPQATQAFAIAARTYLFQNGHYQKGCWSIIDSTKTQRVSPNTPSRAAVEAALFTEDRILKGPPIYYHGTQEGENTLSWENAIIQAQKGWSFEQILIHAYPKSSLETLTQRTTCVRLLEAEAWLKNAIPRWNRTLTHEKGYEPLDQNPIVCSLPNGNPYSDQAHLRIYARQGFSLNDRLTLTHEYLHLAFRFHPHGDNEAYIEHLARQLIGVTP
jgi:uncharacterized protein YfaQ (DUF2300 family)